MKELVEGGGGEKGFGWQECKALNCTVGEDTSAFRIDFCHLDRTMVLVEVSYF
jgi:hypothetical protein